MRNTPYFVLIAAALVLLSASMLPAGVAQMNAVNSLQGGDRTNIGNNPYKDMENNDYVTVNPNYSDQQTVYHDQYGNVAAAPQSADLSGNGNTAVYNGYNTVVAGQYYNDSGWASTVQSGVAVPIGTILEYAPSSAVPVMVRGSRYYYVSNIFLAEVFDGNSVVYQVVPAPIGAVVTQLPAGCTGMAMNGRSVSECAGVYYKQVAGGYEVVASM